LINLVTDKIFTIVYWKYSILKNPLISQIIT